jgi:LytS/YehU family sensor histidine kinase
LSYIQIKELIITLNISTTVALISYLTTRMSSFVRAINHNSNTKDQIFLGIVFGLLSIGGTVLGGGYLDNYTLETALISPAIAGLTCGFIPGILAGIIGGIYGLTGSSITVQAICISCATAGVFGGVIYHLSKHQKWNFIRGTALGLLCEGVWYLSVAVTNHFSMLSVFYIKLLYFPTLIIPLAIGICVSVMYAIIAGKDDSAAESSDRILQILQQSVPIKSSGFSDEAKLSVVKSLHDISGLEFVVYYDQQKKIFTHGSAYWMRGDYENEHFQKFCERLIHVDYSTKFGYQVFVSDILDFYPGKPFKDKRLRRCSLISSPIIVNQEKIGILFAIVKGSNVRKSDILLISGVSRFIGSQIQQHFIDQQARLLASSEYYALKAQVNPHFLFNTLNAINSLTRNDPKKAQSLISDLAAFYRRTLSAKEDLLPLSYEIEVCELFLSIQKARFQERLHVFIDIPPECEDVLFPPFSLQPLVENSFKHGFSQIIGDIKIAITAKIAENEIVLTIEDNGTGFPQDVIDFVRNTSEIPVMGIGLNNINQRFICLFGTEYALHLENTSDGSKVTVRAPLSMLTQEVHSDAETNKNYHS